MRSTALADPSNPTCARNTMSFPVLAFKIVRGPPVRGGKRSGHLFRKLTMSGFFFASDLRFAGELRVPSG